MNTVVPIRADADLSVIPTTSQITKAIANVMKEVDVVAKAGKNAFHGYKYAKMEDILKEITPLLGRHGLVIFQSETGRAMFDNDNVIAIDYSFCVAHESGEIWPDQLRQTGVSRCRDSKGGWDDKSLNKCHTAARKYFLLSLFQIPTGEEADADRGENDGPDRRKTLPKKDAREAYGRLQTELSAITSRVVLKAWGTEAAERIQMMPDDWQDILRLQYQERMLDLGRQEPVQGVTPDASTIAQHNADGVIWEETHERPATPEDFSKGADRTDEAAPAGIDRNIVLDEIKSLIVLRVEPTNERRKLELLQTHFKTISWTEIVNVIPVERLRDGYDSMHFTLEGKHSKYHQERIARAIDHTDVRGVPAFLRRDKPKAFNQAEYIEAIAAE